MTVHRQNQQYYHTKQQQPKQFWVKSLNTPHSKIENILSENTT